MEQQSTQNREFSLDAFHVSSHDIALCYDFIVYKFTNMVMN